MRESFAVIEYHNGNFVMVWGVYTGDELYGNSRREAIAKSKFLKDKNPDSDFVVIPVCLTILE